MTATLEHVTLNGHDLTQAINDGYMDANLNDLIKTINDRLAVIRSRTTVDDFALGTRVRVNSLCSTKYLVGLTGVVTSKRRTKVTIKLDDPKGRFIRYDASGNRTSAEIVCPVALLDQI